MKRKIIYVIVTLLVAVGGVFLYDSAYNEGYDAGYAAGDENGYDRGYENAKDNFYSKSSSEQTTIIDHSAEQQEEFTKTEDAPAGSVFVTRSGEKYHVHGCQYIVGKYNLTMYSSAEEAQWAGYGPCSVCH